MIAFGKGWERTVKLETVSEQVAEVRELGTYIVADPRICHGQLTFRGTRLLVADVLEAVAEGVPWDVIGQDSGGLVPSEAVGEAVLLARHALVGREPAPATA